jgi:hypothetical protein
MNHYKIRIQTKNLTEIIQEPWAPSLSIAMLKAASNFERLCPRAGVLQVGQKVIVDCERTK